MSDEFGPVREDEIPQLTSMLSWSFGFPHADAEPWLRRGGIENVRALRRGGRVVATLLMVPQAQFFAGRSVAAMGIAGVATPPEARGTGAAKAMMVAALREMRARGIATSSLYPATLPLYRGVGYEAAGARYEMTVPISALVAGDRALPVRPMTPSDDAAVEDCYRASAARVNGSLDRGSYIWQRVRSPRGETPRGFVFGRDRVDGYVYLYERRAPGAFTYSLVATNLVARTSEAAHRILTFLADHGTLADSFTWNGSPSDPLFHLMPSLGCATRVHHLWMSRIVDVAAALGARGYPRGMSSALEIEIADDVLPQNEGRYVLHVEGGRGTVKPGGRGALRLHARALAPLFTGHLTPYALATSGQLEGADDDLATAAAIFAAPAPWMPDFF